MSGRGSAKSRISIYRTALSIYALLRIKAHEFATKRNRRKPVRVGGRAAGDGCMKSAPSRKTAGEEGDRAKAAAATAGAWAALALIYRRTAASRPHGAARCARSACWATSRPQAVVGPLFASIKRDISFCRQGRAARATWRRPAHSHGVSSPRGSSSPKNGAA